MAVTIELSNDYGYVILAAVSSVLLGSWHGMRVISFRRKAKVPLPYAYASYEQVENAKTQAEKDALMQFNCAQRAHYNYLENHSMNLALLLISGVQYPRLAAGLGFAWCFNRALYMVGYTNLKKKNGDGRYLGGLHFLPYLGLFLLTGKMGWDMIMA